MKVTLENLLSTGTIPKCVPVTVEKTATLAYSALPTVNYIVPEGSIVVADGYVWVAYSEDKDIYFSANDKGEVCRYDVAHHNCSIQIIKKGRLKTTKNTNLKNREDVEQMAENKDLAGLGDLNLDMNLEGLGDSEDNTNTKKMEAFTDAGKGKKDVDPEAEAKKKEKEEKRSKLEKMISADTDGVKLADTSILTAFNRNLGALFGYVTANDALIKFGTSTVIVKDESKKPKLSSTASADARNAVARGQSIAGISKDNFVTETYLTKKQTTPGKVLASVIAIPEGGNVAFSDLFQEGVVKPDESKRDLQFLLLDNDEAIQVVAQLFDGSIKESPITFGDQATTVDVKLRFQDSKDQDDRPVIIKKFSLKPYKRSNKMTENSYFPLKTFKTINLSGNISEEESHLLAESSFRHFYQTANKTKGRKIEVLRAEDKACIEQSEDGVFTSKFFAPNISERLPLDIKPAFTSNKEAKLQKIEIPIKEEKISKTSNNPTYKYIAYDVLGKLDTPEAKELNSLAQAKAGGKFSIFFNAVGGDALINEENLRKVKPRRGGKSDKSKDVDSKTIRELLGATLQGKEGTLQFDKAPTSSMSTIENKLFEARMNTK